jgi:hypothetical protein
MFVDHIRCLHNQILNCILSPPQRLLKNMKFEGIEIALEGIWYEDNRWKSAVN